MMFCRTQKSSLNTLACAHPLCFLVVDVMQATALTFLAALCNCEPKPSLSLLSLSGHFLTVSGKETEHHRFSVFASFSCSIASNSLFTKNGL